MGGMDQVLRIMSPAQIRSIARAPQAKISLWEGSVSAGKTIASLFALLLAIRDAPRNGLIVIIGKTLATVHQNVFFNLQDPKIFGTLANQVQYTRGATSGRILGREVLVMGANDKRAEEKVRGATAALIYVDEATILPDEAFFNMLVTRLRIPGARMLATTNPGARNHWLRINWMLRPAEVEMQVFSFRMSDNPSLTPEYMASMERTFTGVFYQRFILGMWTNAEGAIYDMWMPEKHVIPWMDLPEMHQLVGVGIDYGTQHASSAIMLGLGVDRRLYLVDEWRQDPSKPPHLNLTDVQQSQMIKAWLTQSHLPYLTGLKPQWLVCDPAPRHFREQLYNDGVVTQAADNEVAGGIRTVASLLGQGKLLVADRCHGFIEEIPGYVWDAKVAERGEDKPVKEKDDSMDAARYIVHSTREFWRLDLQLQAA